MKRFLLAVAVTVVVVYAAPEVVRILGEVIRRRA